MAIFNNQKVKIAAPSKTKLRLDSQHITTSDFMRLQPVYYRHMVPGEKLQVSHKTLSRLAPMAVPTYGRANLHLRSFFVPYRVVNPYFNEFIADTVYSNSSVSAVPTTVPFLKNSTLRDYLRAGNGQANWATDLGTTITPGTVYDFFTGGHYYAYLSKGRHCAKILNSLGYRAVWDTKEDYNLNALGILCYAKVYLDWYALGQFLNSSSYLAISKLFAANNPSSALELSVSDLDTILTFVEYVSYGQDYFTSAWFNPVAPSANTLYSSIALKDVTNNGTTPALVDNTTITNGTPSAAGTLTEYTMHLLHSLNNYVKRHQMSGARAIDRLLVDYGIQLRSEKLNRSVYLGEDVMPLQIGDVTSTADTATAGNPSNLGDYAGKGYIQGSKVFQYESEEFGMFIIAVSIVPAVGYVQGFDRHNLHMSKFDWWNPSFDNCGVQGVSKGELYVSKDENFGSAGKYLENFGFLPRYAEYKAGRDFLTGDFGYDSGNVGRTAWNMFRIFDNSSFASLNPTIGSVTQSYYFCSGRDSAQYNRIFQLDSEDFEHFYLFFDFEVNAYAPVLPLYDTYRFEGEEDHDSVVIQSNGTQLN